MNVQLPIYLDYNATTPVDPRVMEAMAPYFTRVYGNSSSVWHTFGEAAAEGVAQARQEVADLIGASPKEIVFTAGATESNNLAIKGVAEMYKERGNHIVTARTEHKAVLEPCRHLEQMGYEVTWLQTDEYGCITPQQVEEAITDKTILISLMASNNEIGTIHPVAEIGRIAKERGVLFHCDATQSLGKVDVDVEAMGVDLLSLSGHKLYAPKGIGAIYLRRRGPHVRVTAQMEGGGHERGIRSGTLNVPGIVGLGAACRIAAEEMSDDRERVLALRDRLHEGLAAKIDHIKLNGHPTQRLPNTLNLSFAYVEGESMMLKLRDIAVSTGSACGSTSLEPSYVLRAIGVGDELAHGSLRFSLGRFTTAEQIEYVIDRVVKAVGELREMSPLYEMAMESANSGGKEER